MFSLLKEDEERRMPWPQELYIDSGVTAAIFVYTHFRVHQEVSDLPEDSYTAGWLQRISGGV